MKKLMLAAAAVAIAGSASAVMVYEYRATVRHPYLRSVTTRSIAGLNITVQAKTLTSTSLRGFLIQDDEAVLNGGRLQAGTAALGGNDFGGNALITGPGPGINAGQQVGQPENRCFLVAINSAAGRWAYPRIIPGVIEAKWYNPTFNTSASVPAQGYLWLGGEVVTAAKASIGAGSANASALVDEDGNYKVYGHKNLAALTAPVAAPAQNRSLNGLLGNTGVQVWNYAFTSEYLFGRFNGKAGSTDAFADCWLNGAGFGTAGVANSGDVCCGWDSRSSNLTIQSLQGNLKGGIYLCTDNGDDFDHSRPFGFGATARSFFEQQLWASYGGRLNAGGVIPAEPAPGTIPAIPANYDDLWVDGPFELNTTDCASGTWSIRLVTRDMAVALDTAATGEERQFNTVADYTAWSGLGLTAALANFNLPSDERVANSDFEDGTLELLETIKGCMKSLDRNARMLGRDRDAAPNSAEPPTAMIGPTFFNAYLAQ